MGFCFFEVSSYIATCVTDCCIVLSVQSSSVVMTSPMRNEFLKKAADTNRNLQTCKEIDIDWTLYPEVVQKVILLFIKEYRLLIVGVELFAEL